MKTTTFHANSVKLIVDNLEIDQLAASASISLNPNVTWLKLVLTDDKFNANKQRIPKEEFSNVMRTGIFMPIKMAYHEISTGHEGTYPLGVMAHLKTEGNSVQALAALWDKERGTDVEYIKNRYKDGESIDISWEITYSDDEIEEEGSALRGVAMNAATIVGMPAYEGRTPVLAVSSKEENKEGDSDNMDTIELVKHQQLLEEQKASYESKLSELTEQFNGIKAELDELKPKYEDLESYKAEIEREKAEKERLASIRTKFDESGLKITDEYFTERSASFLAMSDEQIDFFVQELLAAFDKKEEDNSDSSASTIPITSKIKIPKLNSPKSDITTEDILTLLKDKQRGA